MNSNAHLSFTPEQLTAFMETASAALELEIPARYRAGVIANLERLFELGDKVMGFPLPDGTELAPVFRP